MNFDGMGDHIRELGADLLIESKKVWVDYSGHVCMGDTSNGVFAVDMMASELFELVEQLMRHPDLYDTVVTRKLSDGSVEPIKKEIVIHLLNDDNFYEVRRILQKRFVENGKASGILVNPKQPDAKAIAVRIMNDCTALIGMVDKKHHDALETLRKQTWQMLDIIDPILDENENEAD